MNLQKMLENRKAAAAESLALGTENPQTFQTQRTPEGDCSLCAPRRGAGCHQGDLPLN